MMVGFKKQFEPMVKDGSKTHTVRKPGRYRVGQRLDLYVDPRQKSMRLLGRFPCVRVEPIQIWMDEAPVVKDGYRLVIQIGGDRLTPSEARLFAYRDGFRSQCPLREMRDFWIKQHKLKPLHKRGGKVWRGDVVYWDFSRPQRKPAKRITRRRAAYMRAMR